MTLLEDTPLPDANAVLDNSTSEENPAPVCHHWLLDPSEGALRPEDEERCSKCNKNWSELLQSCLESEGHVHYAAYACSTGLPVNHYLVHGASSFCPHCQLNRLSHIARTITKVCSTVLSIPGLVVPTDDKRGQEEFSSRGALWALFQSYPNEVCSSMADWIKEVRSQQVEGDVIGYLIPKVPLHGDACTEECHEGFKVDVLKLLDEEFGTDTSFTIGMKPPSHLRAKKGTGSDKTSKTVSKPQINVEIDTEEDTGDAGEGEIPSGKHLSPLITDQIAWRGTCQEYLPFFYDIGARKKRELYVISQAIRCRQDPSNRGPPKLVPSLYLRASVSNLKKRADKLLAGVKPLDVIQPPNSANQQAPGTFVTPFVPTPRPRGPTNFGGSPRFPARGKSAPRNNYHNHGFARGRGGGRGRGSYQNYPDYYSNRSTYFTNRSGSTSDTPTRDPAAVVPMAKSVGVPGGSGVPPKSKIPQVIKGKGGKGRGGVSNNAHKNRKTSEQLNKSGSADLETQLDQSMEQYQLLQANRAARKVPGEKVKCLKASCKAEFTTGVGDFCGACGSNQNVEMAAALKRISKMQN